MESILEVCCLRHTATGHVEPPVTHQEVLVEQRSIWTQHWLSAALIGADEKHLNTGYIRVTICMSEGSGLVQHKRWTLMWHLL